MATIRLSPNCASCTEFSDDAVCGIHEVKIKGSYICDSFTWRDASVLERQCGNCSRFSQTSCAHPDRAATGMLCSSWAPGLN